MFCTLTQVFEEAIVIRILRRGIIRTFNKMIYLKNVDNSIAKGSYSNQPGLINNRIGKKERP
jgi:hypothetical protein